NEPVSCIRNGGICQYRCIGLRHKIGTCGSPFKCCK
nr:Chain A, Beta-defensin 8